MIISSVMCCALLSISTQQNDKLGLGFSLQSLFGMGTRVMYAGLRQGR